MTPFRDLIPDIMNNADVSVRQAYFDFLLWLLRRDLVVQVHTRARIFAQPEVKEIAWRRLWKRRRDRWLAGLSQQSRKASTEAPLSPTTPKARLHDGNSIVTSQPGTPQLVPRMEQSYLDYDPDLEMDSDAGEGEDTVSEDMIFTLDQEEPDISQIPRFSGSFIFKPGRAQKDEARWLRVIREGPGQEIWASKFDL